MIYLLVGKLSIDEAKKRFKSLRDTYRKVINSESRASGSAAPTKNDNKWKHYYNLSFLMDLDTFERFVSKVYI